MALLIANAVNILYGSHDLTCDANQIDIDPKADSVDSTTFCTNGWRTFLPGLKDFDFKVMGFWQADSVNGAVHDTAWAALGNGTVPTTVIPDPTLDIALLLQVMEDNYNVPLQIGQIAKFEIDGKGSSGQGIVGGHIFIPKTTATTSGTSSVITAGDLTGVPAGETLFTTVHVFAASGGSPTLDVTVKSAASSGFGSPTTRLTVPTLNAVGASWNTATPTTTDAYWRVDYAIGGTSPSFTFAVAVGIR